jgi:hypothetical protein
MSKRKNRQRITAPEPRHRPIFRFWAVPSFEPITSWTILAIHTMSGLQKLMVRRVIGSKFSSITFHDIDKTLQEDMALEDAKVGEYYFKPHEFEGLGFYQKISFQPLTTDWALGLDGTVYGMQLCQYDPYFDISWWEDGPDSWHEMTKWAKQTMAYLSEWIDQQAIEFKDINQLHPPDHKIWTRLDK